MAPTLLEGSTLGDRQKHYNTVLKDELIKSLDLEGININDTDIDNLLKIDIASSNKNVEYILEVLKSEDMLYVSRAIKRCTWLITDPQYAHIVNPHYLHTQLFPHMTTKATNKLMLHIRLNLSDEVRVESFYKHYKNIDINTAFKWLPHCSLIFIEKEIENNEEEFLIQPVVKRLCERSFSFVEMLIRNCVNYTKNILIESLFLLNTDAEKYCDILEKVKAYEMPDLGPKYTRLIMKKCPQRILNNFEIYCCNINLHIFAKCLKKRGTNINAFLLKQFENTSMKVWFKYDNLKHFMPKEFEFLKKVLIEKPHKVDISTKSDDMANVSEIYTTAELFSAMLTSSRNTNVYNWYRYAPFDIAFTDLKKMIRAESAPAERTAMLGVLVSCAGQNLQHMHTLLQYYHDKHINEPFQFKIQFINNLLLKTATHRFTNETWNVLNNIFCSMEVYTESVNNAQICIQSIVVYKVLHDLKIPEVVENKFTFDTLKSQRKRLNETERVKIFNYLFNNLLTEIENKHNIQNETEFVEVLDLLEKVLDLLKNWKKELFDYPLVINEIEKLVKIKRRTTWSVDMSCLYNREKSWRKHLFEYSLVLFPSQEVCINALKHDPKLLERYRSEVEALCCNDRMPLARLLSKLRIYWPESMAREWADWYLGRLDSSGGHKALVRGLCALLPQKQLVDIIIKYAPTESKIIWNEEDNIQLNMRRQFAKNLYLARPPPPSDIVLLYARGDYLQFALPSLNALLCNLSPLNSCDQITKFLDAPVSLQKHGIRLAFNKLKSRELKKIISDIWKSNKNPTIRSILFTQTFCLLCKEKNSVMIEEIWEVLSMFIDSLGTDEKNTIYQKLAYVASVPFIIRAEFCMKSYKFLKSLPAKSEYEKLIARVINSTLPIMEFLDAEFVADMLQGTLDNKYAKQRYGYPFLLSSFLMCTKDEKAQIQRYETILVPLLERSINQWQLNLDGCYFASFTVNDMLRQLCYDIPIYGLKNKMVIPVNMFEDIQNRLEKRLSMPKNYTLLRSWKLAVTYIKLLNTHVTKISSITEGTSYSQTSDKETHDRLNELHIKIAPEFSETCINYLKEDVKTYFASICVLFAEALKNMFSYMQTYNTVHFETLKYMLGHKDFIEGHIVVLRILPKHFYINDDPRILEMRKIICSNASPEIKMHYYKKFSDCKLNEED